MLGFCNQCSQVYSCYVPIRDSFRAPQCEMSAILQYNKVTQRDIDQGNFCQLSFIAVRIPWVNPAQAARTTLFLEWEAGSWKRKCRHLFNLFVQIRNSWACTGCCSLFRADHKIESISRKHFFWIQICYVLLSGVYADVKSVSIQPLFSSHTDKYKSDLLHCSKGPRCFGEANTTNWFLAVSSNRKPTWTFWGWGKLEFESDLVSLEISRDEQSITEPGPCAKVENVWKGNIGRWEALRLQRRNPELLSCQSDLELQRLSGCTTAKNSKLYWKTERPGLSDCPLLFHLFSSKAFWHAWLSCLLWSWIQCTNSSQPCPQRLLVLHICIEERHGNGQLPMKRILELHLGTC